MKTHFRILGRRVLLLVGVSFLSGCSMFGIKNPFINDRPEQQVVGGRRPPILNVAPPAALPDAIAPSTALVTPVPPSHISQAQVRKPIPGNPGSGGALDMSAAPQTSATLGHIGNGESAAAPVTATADEPRTPELSSVPPTPAQFDEIKANRQQEVQGLQSDHEQAQQEKAALMAEPSQQQNVIAEPPVPLVPAPTPSTPPSSAPPVLASTPALASTSGTPRPGIDIMTQAQWNALQKAQKEKTSVPLPPSSANPVVSAPATAEDVLVPAPTDSTNP